MNRTQSLLCLALAGLLLAVPANGRAQTNFSANRFLFIVETSKAMKAQFPATARSVEELVVSGIGGQLRPGDTLGLWTYDSELHAGLFPMQLWRGDNRNAIAEGFGEFLRAQKPKGRAKLEVVLPEMLRLFAESEALTVLLYSDGAQPVEGTPFDDSINEIFKLHRKELADAKIPFVTILVGREGKIVKCAMNSAEGVNVPAVPLPGPVVSPATSAPPVAVVKSVARTNAPLIVDYSKSNLVKTATGETSRPRVPIAGGNGPAAKAGISNLPTKAEPVPPVPTVLIEPPPPQPVVPPAPAPVATNPEPAAAVTNEVAPVPEVASPPVVSNPPVVKPPAPVVVPTIPKAAEATPPAASVERSRRLVAVVVLLAACIVGGFLGWVLWRQMRPHKTGSLITKSFERGKRP